MTPYEDNDSVDIELGIALLSSVRMISFSTWPGVSLDGEGERTREGTRWCLVRLEGVAASNVEVGFLSGESITGDVGKGVVAGDENGLEAGFDGFQSKPGLIIKLTVFPSLTAYSFSSFPSARAFPFNRRR